MQNVVKTATEIFHNLKQARGFTSDADLARDMGVPPKKLSVWKLRNTVPLNELTAYCRRYGFNLEAVLTGEGNIQIRYFTGTDHPIILVEEPEISIHPSVVKKIQQLLADMSDDQKRDVLKYAEEKKLLSELMEERQHKKAG